MFFQHVFNQAGMFNTLHCPAKETAFGGTMTFPSTASGSTRRSGEVIIAPIAAFTALGRTLVRCPHPQFHIQALGTACFVLPAAGNRHSDAVPCDCGQGSRLSLCAALIEAGR